MADDIVIRAGGLGKKYVIGHEAERERYPTLRDMLARGARNAWRKTTDMARGRAIVGGDRVEDFWALKDVSFEVKRGEVLGIIGRNGAGKSTLLKVLSRITEPTEGRVTINGRVASLLEVGTGFHPELTGRENVYLNGAILGMARAEIKRKFDEIVAFADIEKFLDTPVKRYSSGMYVRLAFAVAAHLEPEILIVDEVLAVGDAEFQKKCLGKMSEFSRREGRTVLFVSHNLGAVESLCSGCALLDGGELVLQSSDTKSVIRRYQFGDDSRPDHASARLPVNTPFFDLIDFSLKRRGAIHNPSNSYLKSDEIILDITSDVHRADLRLHFGYSLYGEDHRCIWWSFDHDLRDTKLSPGRNYLRTAIPHSLLNNGTYTIEFLAWSDEHGWLIGPGDDRSVLLFCVQGGRVGSLAFSGGTRPGVLYPPLPWDVNFDSDQLKEARMTAKFVDPAITFRDIGTGIG
jgi:lipopolysaccharide transport system ATP-binding protein